MTLTDEEISKLSDVERREWLKQRIAGLQHQQKENPVPRERAVVGETSDDWLDHAFGIFADSPEFERAVRSGQEWRYADAPREGNV